MMNRFVLLKIMVLSSLIIGVFNLAACGGGSSATHSNTPVTVKLASKDTNGVPSNNLIGLSVTLQLSPGVTIATDAGGSVMASELIPSGKTANNAAAIPPEMVVYKAATPGSGGSISFVLVSTDPSGFSTGEFASLTVIMPSGMVPSSALSVSEFKPIDTRAKAVQGLSLLIQ